jgi:hypothetical protein
MPGERPVEETQVLVRSHTCADVLDPLKALEEIKDE